MREQRMVVVGLGGARSDPKATEQLKGLSVTFRIGQCSVLEVDDAGMLLNRSRT